MGRRNLLHKRSALNFRPSGNNSISIQFLRTELLGIQHFHVYFIPLLLLCDSCSYSSVVSLREEVETMASTDQKECPHFGWMANKR